jgi:hypothetical protein
MDVLTTIVVPASRVETARLLGAALARSGAGMYTAALSPTGDLPATHYISSGLIGTGFVSLLNNPAALFGCAQQGAALQGYPLLPTLVETTELIPLCDVSHEGPFVVMYRLGLRMVAE